MKFGHILGSLALIGILLPSIAARADSLVTFGNATASPDPIDGSGTPGSSLTLAATTPTSVGSDPTVITQGLTFTSGYDGNGGPLPFTISDPVVVDGTASSILITGTFLVSPTADPDTVSIDAATYEVGGVTLSLAGLSFPDTPPFPGGITNEDLTITSMAATPEPNSMLLLGTGLMGVAGMARRKFRLG